jgi:hypothetical protein
VVYCLWVVVCRPRVGRAVGSFVWWCVVVASFSSLAAASSALGASRGVAFSGSRSLPPSAAPFVSRVVRSVVAGGAVPVVGCAGGADALVRAASVAAGVSPVVVAARGFGGARVLSRGLFAARSAACVRAAAGSAGGFVAFVASACPAGVVPSASPSVAFGGGGSGSWASVAFAAGLALRGGFSSPLAGLPGGALPVVVFPGAGVGLPVWPGLVWRPACVVPGSCWSLGWRLWLAPAWCAGGFAPAAAFSSGLPWGSGLVD